MIEFVTLFLGLAAGPQTVEVTAGDATAEVRLLLDGEIVATDSDSPWSLSFDLGAAMRPHLLEAVAFDGNGRELGRAAQPLNLPRPAAEARIALEREPDGRVTEAHLSWESTVRARPLRTEAWLDEAPLDVSDMPRIPIPSYDRTTFHLLQAELEFSADVAAHAHAAFGGAYADESRTDLTAFPVVAARRARQASPDAMSDWFLTSPPSRVVALEKGGLDLVLVRGPGVSRALAGLEGGFTNDLTSGGLSSGGSPGGVGSINDVGQIANMGVARETERLRQVMALEGNQRLRILEPRARRQTGRGTEMEVFALSPEITNERGGLYWALMQEIELPGLAPELRLADAVSVAALQAANGNRRRAVLLVLADEASDESRHAVSTVRSYLAALQVPLVVWRVGEGAGAWREWGEATEIPHFRGLQNSARKLADQLDRQAIVWLEGHHLPNAVELTATARRYVSKATAGL